MKTAKKAQNQKLTHLKHLARFVHPRRLSDRVALPNYPDCPGVYVLSSVDDEILYVGHSKQLCRRVSHLTAMQRDNSSKQGRSHIKADLVRDHQRNFGKVYVSFLETNTEAAARKLEKDIRNVINKRWNVR
jgi:excinuclease UvrABC nuclease subunit